MKSKDAGETIEQVVNVLKENATTHTVQGILSSQAVQTRFNMPVCVRLEGPAVAGAKKLAEAIAILKEKFQASCPGKSAGHSDKAWFVLKLCWLFQLWDCRMCLGTNLWGRLLRSS